LEGKAALITGASAGIGAAAARELAKHGVKLVLVARSVEAIEELAAEIKADGGKATAVPCDVSDHAAMTAAVKTCVNEFGSIDILVNNAGVIDPISRLTESDPEDWGNSIDINLKGVYNGLHNALPQMEGQKSGVVINISSGAANQPLEGWSAYCASKAAARMLTRAAHLEYAAKGIRVVGLSPGTVATEMQVKIKASGINPVSELDPSVHIPAEWVAKAICWLATEDAREFDGDDVSLRDEEIRQRCGVA
ncbi:MAG: SDR family oxidoreductase, partial [Pseudomonadota bacterium]